MTDTSLGFPYPPNLDAANDPPADFKALAQAVNDYLIANKPRVGTLTPTAPPGTNTYTVTFTAPFPTGVVPRVAISLDSNLDWVSAGVQSVTNTGFAIRLRNGFSSGISAKVDYIAIRP